MRYQLKWLSTGCIAALCFLSACNDQPKADLLVYNAVVYTVDEAFHNTEAFAVKDGIIIETGTTSSLLEKYKAKEMVDAHGKPVYPGLIDAHAHFVGYGRGLFEVNLFDCKDWTEAIERIKVFAKEHPNEKWIRGRGWDQNKFPGKAYPDNKELNELFPAKPVLLSRIDGHAAIANNKALELAQVTAATSILGGKIEMANGKPTGLLIDNAVDLVTNIIPKATKDEYVKWLTKADSNCHKQGITTVADCGLQYSEIKMLDVLQQEGTITMRVYAMLSDDTFTYKQYMSARSEVMQGNDANAKNRYIGNGPYKTDRLFVKGVKAYADGALGSRGACLLKHYADQPGWSGFLLASPAHYDSLAQMLAGTDFQMCTHAIGDSGNRVVLQVYQKYLKGKNDRRWRIEHAQVVHPDDFHLFGECSIVPSVQPTHATSDMSLMLKDVYLSKGYEDTLLNAYKKGTLTQKMYYRLSADTMNWAGNRLGGERMKGAYAYKQLLEQNGWLPLGTDFPVEDISPFKTFYSAVFRKDRYACPPKGFQMENALTREQAIRGMTIWAAKACFLESEVGSIEVGKKADFIIVDTDLMEADERAILNTKVTSTYVDGKRVH